MRHLARSPKGQKEKVSRLKVTKKESKRYKVSSIRT
jgi:hypothetical protein